jgi:hypothetical protein
MPRMMITTKSSIRVKPCSELSRDLMRPIIDEFLLPKGVADGPRLIGAPLSIELAPYGGFTLTYDEGPANAGPSKVTR